MLWGCSRTVLVSVPPRVDLRAYGTVGIVEFASNSERAINELGYREAVLAAVGGARPGQGASSASTFRPSLA